MDRHHVDPLALPGERERACLRERLRQRLAVLWPAHESAHRAGQPAAVAALWQALAAEGIAAIGFDPAAGGLREALVVAGEIGRAGCIVPIVGHLLGNLVLARDWRQPLVDEQVRARLHGGAMRMTIAFAGAPPHGDGCIECGDGYVTGLLHNVDAALQASHVLLCAPGGLLVADLGSPGVSVIAADGTPGAPCALVRLEQVAIDVFPLPAGTLADLRLLAQLLLAARRHGVARREADAAGLANAAQAFDVGSPHWRAAAAEALAAEPMRTGAGGYEAVTGTRCASAHISS